MEHIGEISIAAHQRISGIRVTLEAGKTAAIGAEAKRPDGSAGLTAAGLAFHPRAESLGENQNVGGARSIEIKRT